MRKEDKSTIIEQIAATVKEYGHFYLIDTTAMNAADTSALRALCFKADIKLMVVKNTLLHKALESLEEDYSPLYGCMKGTTAVMFCNTANAPAKLLKDKAKNGIPGLKAAYAEESFYVGADQRRERLRHPGAAGGAQCRCGRGTGSGVNHGLQRICLFLR